MKIKNILPNLIANLFLIIFSAFCIIPFITIISISISDEKSIGLFGYQIIPKIFSMEAYNLLFQKPDVIMNAYGITILVSIVGTILSLIVCSQFAYTLSRNIFFLKKQLSFFLFFTMLFNGGLVPWYILITKYLSLKNSVWALILPMLVNAWNIFLLRTFFKGIPDSLIEAAKIDGASEYYIFYKIVLPLSTGGIATVSIFTILAFWNDWYNNMLFISEPKLYSLQYMLYNVMSKVQFLQLANLSGTSSGMKLPQETLRMATCIVAAGPMILIFPFFQRYFVKGITVGAVKG